MKSVTAQYLNGSVEIALQFYNLPASCYYIINIGPARYELSGLL